MEVSKSAPEFVERWVCLHTGIDRTMKATMARDLDHLLHSAKAETKELAEQELQKYVTVLLELYGTRCMSLFEGMVAGFCTVKILTKDEGRAWLDKVRDHVRCRR